jgi:hypothetical protein
VIDEPGFEVAAPAPDVDLDPSRCTSAPAVRISTLSGAAPKREIDRGEDPVDGRKSGREAPEVQDLVGRYIEEHLPKLGATNAADQKSMLHKLVLPAWRTRKVAELTPTDVDRLLTKIAEGRARPAKKQPKAKRRKPLKPTRPTPVRANRVGEVLRKMFNLAIQWRMRTDDPALGFRKRPETARERFLSFEEIERLPERPRPVEQPALLNKRFPHVSISRRPRVPRQAALWLHPRLAVSTASAKSRAAVAASSPI